MDHYFEGNYERIISYLVSSHNIKLQSRLVAICSLAGTRIFLLNDNDPPSLGHPEDQGNMRSERARAIGPAAFKYSHLFPDCGRNPEIDTFLK